MVSACISIRATFFQADNCQKIGLLNMLPDDIDKCQSIDHIKVLSTAKVSWMSSLPLIALPSCRLASSSAHDRYICQEVKSLDIQSKAQPVCAAEPMMAGFVCGLLWLPDTVRASTGHTAFLRSRDRS